MGSNYQKTKLYRRKKLPGKIIADPVQSIPNAESSSDENVDVEDEIKKIEVKKKLHDKSLHVQLVNVQPVHVKLVHVVTNKYQLFIVLPVALLLLVCCIVFNNHNTQPVQKIPHVWKDYLHDLQMEFQKQSVLTWTIFNRTVNKLIKAVKQSDNRGQAKPITITVLGTEGGREFVNCFSKRIQDIVNSLMDKDSCTEINATTFQLMNDSQVKSHLQSELEITLTKPCHAVLVKDIDFLQSAGMTTLQPYSDDTSLYKQVILILTATTENPFPEQSEIHVFSEITRKHLEKVWRKEDDDYRSAWLSRILDNVVVTKTVNTTPMCFPNHA